jgi:VIT1/CCC1 family predicted Fe2+/Mn2+ transporter
MIDGLLIGAAFVFGGLIPVLPFLTPIPYPQAWAYGLTAVTALVFGGMKARYTLKGPVRSGVEFLIIVTVGTLAGVAAGLILRTA